MITSRAFGLLLLAVCALSGPFGDAAAAQGAGTPPRISDLLVPPAMSSPQLSPDGSHFVYLRHPQPGDPDDSVIMVVVADITDPDAPVRRAIPVGGLEVTWTAWGNNERLLVGLLERTELEDGYILIIGEDGTLKASRDFDRTRVISVGRDGRDPQVLFSQRRFNTVFNTELDRVTDFLPDDPDHILMPARNRSGRLDLYRVDLHTGQARRDEIGRTETIRWYTNRNGEAVMRFDAVGWGAEIDVLVRAADGHLWRRVERSEAHDFGRLQQDYLWVARAENFDEALVYARSPDTGTTGLFRYSFTHEALGAPVFLDAQYDIRDVWIDPFSARPLFIRYADTHPRLHVTDAELGRHLEGLQAFFGSGIAIEPLQRVGSRVLLRISGATEPVSFYLYDMAARSVHPLGAERPVLFNRRMARVSVHHYTARDGTGLFGYLTHPQEPVGSPPPLVVLPHGGPERRDYLGFNDVAQILASQGYLVFQPQFRGSYGFGQAFSEAGYREWGGLMQDDVTDGVLDLVQTGHADGARMCIAGFSYGGYAALMGAVKTPDLYRCAASLGGVSDLPALIEYQLERDENARDYLLRAIGDPETQGAELAQTSPARRAGEIGIPVLLLHGTADRTVPIEQSERMKEALEAAGGTVTLIPNSGGHDFDEPDIFSTTMFHLTGFLDEHLQETR